MWDCSKKHVCHHVRLDVDIEIKLQFDYLAASSVCISPGPRAHFRFYV